MLGQHKPGRVRPMERVCVVVCTEYHHHMLRICGLRLKGQKNAYDLLINILFFHIIKQTI